MDLKPAKTFNEQIKRIKEHGFAVDDENQLKKFLKSANYYRFSAYFMPYKHAVKKPNISIPIRLYEFDKVLRTWLYKVVGDIEYYTKTQIAYYLAHEVGEEAHLDQTIFNQKHNHANFLSKHQKVIAENEKTLIVKHHRKKYNNRFPIWVIIEFYSVGMISMFYSDLISSHQKRIAKNSFKTGYKQLSSWLRVLTELRNKCAHYTRFYLWKFRSIPKNNNANIWFTDSSLFSQIYCLAQLYADYDEWVKNINVLENILNDYDDSVLLKHLGFPKEWKTILLTRNLGCD